MVISELISGATGGATVFITIKAIDKFSNTFSRATGGINKFSAIAQIGIGAAVALGTAVAAISVSAIKLASDFEEVDSKFKVVFKDVGAESEEIARTLQKNFGLSTRAAKELLGTTGDLLTGFGFTGEEALDLSKQVNELAADLASFTNLAGGTEQASRALTRGLLGEREMMKTLGIAILEVDIKNRALLEGMDPNNLTRQEKALLTLTLATEQSKNAIGDFERTQGSFANQSRILQATLEDLKLEFGEELLPEVTKLVVKFNDELLPAIKPLIPVMGQIINQGIVLAGVIIEDIIPVMEDWLPILKDLLDILLPIAEVLSTIIGFLGKTIVKNTGIAAFSEAFSEILRSPTSKTSDPTGIFNQQSRLPTADPFTSTSSRFNVGDAIIRPNGDIIRTDPRDTLIATKGGIGGVTLIVQGSLIGLNESDISRALSDELNTKLSL